MKHGVIRGIGKLEDERRIVFLLVMYRICIKALWYYGEKGKLEDKKRKEIKRYIRDTYDRMFTSDVLDCIIVLFVGYEN